MEGFLMLKSNSNFVIKLIEMRVSIKAYLVLLISLLTINSTYVEAQTQLWGLTSGGGINNAGILFNTDSIGDNISVQYNFLQHPGKKPLFSGIMQASDSMLYGMTYLGGANNFGVLFQYNPVTSSYKVKFDFDSINGSKALGSLLQANNGLIYGLAYKGGLNDKGVLFVYNPVTSTYTKKFDFSALNGCYPHGSLIQANNDKLYGVAVQGGINDKGVIFQYDPVTSIFTKKMDFDSVIGANPAGSLMLVSDSLIFGLTAHGGIYNKGVLFQYNINSGIYSKKVDFDGALLGNSPLGYLIQGADGMLYGMTNRGGANDMGVLFKYNLASASCTKAIDFDSINGSYPAGSLMLAIDGMIYGMTEMGGANDWGILFQYNPSTSVIANKLDFAGTSTGGSPYGTLMQAFDGNLYGMTNIGGYNGLGVLFQYNPVTAVYNKQFDFGANNGRYPVGSLMYATDGNIYGLTSEGGAFDLGTLFEYNPVTFAFAKKFDFSGSNDGSYPMGSLIQASDGNLYGITKWGGGYDFGTLYQYNPITGTVTDKFDFDSITGRYPHGSLVQAVDGNIYGLTYQGGVHDMGVLFKYNPATSIISNVFDFDGAANGSYPYGSLIQANDGNLYGMTSGGGVHGMGSIFKFSTGNSIVTKLFDFDGSATGSNPKGALIQANDSNLYGLTLDGGTNNKGVLFQFNTATLNVSKKLDFDGANYGSNPYGSLIQAHDGNLYGLTDNGGINDEGVLFQYNMVTSTVTKKSDFNTSYGKNPFGNLIEVNTHDAGVSAYQHIINDISVFPNPNNGSFTIKSTYDGVYTITNDMGQVIESVKLNTANGYFVDVDNLSNGIYFITCFSNNKLIKQKVAVIK